MYSIDYFLGSIFDAGHCHRDCTVSSTFSTNEEVEFVIMCKLCYHGKILAQNGTCIESPTSPLHLQVPKYQNLITATKGAKSSIRAQDTHSESKQTRPESSLAAKSRRKSCNWGVIWKKKNNKNSSVSDKKVKDESIDFRLNNILLKGGGSGVHRMEPQCHLCRKPYRSDLMYICCVTCKSKLSRHQALCLFLFIGKISLFKLYVCDHWQIGIMLMPLNLTSQRYLM